MFSNPKTIKRRNQCKLKREESCFLLGCGIGLMEERKSTPCVQAKQIFSFCRSLPFFPFLRLLKAPPVILPRDGPTPLLFFPLPLHWPMAFFNNNERGTCQTPPQTPKNDIPKSQEVALVVCFGQAPHFKQPLRISKTNVQLSLTPFFIQSSF